MDKGKKQNQRVMLTKRLLKENFIELLKTQSIYKISVRDLCEKAGINRSTFYKYYGSQFDLLKEMEDDMLSLILEILSDQSKSQIEAIGSICEYLEKNIELGRLLINNNVDPEFPQKLFTLPMIRQKIAEVLGPPYSQEESEYVSCFLSYGAYNLLRMWINKDARQPSRELAKLINSLIGKVIENRI